jgi:hypothetical protein
MRAPLTWSSRILLVIFVTASVIVSQGNTIWRIWRITLTPPDEPLPPLVPVPDPPGGVGVLVAEGGGVPGVSIFETTGHISLPLGNFEQSIWA